jgi:DNA polymerase III sliding clamp (beta) subunit (PCNA family)
MKFQVNVENFVKAIEPVVYLANHISNKNFTDNCMIELQSSSNKIIASACIGSALIKVTVLEKDYYNLQYYCHEEGTTTVNAINFMNSLASFAPTDSIVISTSNGRLTIADETNEDDYQALLENNEGLYLPTIADCFDKSMTIDRKILIDGLKSVAFAMGHAITQEHYMVLLIEASKNKVRFAAGTGARFAVKDFHGNGIVDGKASFVLPCYDIFNLISILSKSSANKIQIKQSETYMDSIVPNQIFVEFNETSIILFQAEPSVVYPSMDTIIDYDYKNRASAKLSDWKRAIKGITATDNKEFKEGIGVHNSTVSADAKRGYFVVEATTTNMDAQKLVCFTKKPIVADTLADGHLPWFRVNTMYLQEVIKYASKVEEVAFCFEDTELFKNSEKTQRPVLVKYSEIISNGIKEQLYMFFATSKL